MSYVPVTTIYPPRNVVINIIQTTSGLAPFFNVGLTWELVNGATTNTTTRYNVYRATNQNGPFVFIGFNDGTSSGGANGRSLGNYIDSDASLALNTVYYYKITARGTNGIEGKASDPVWIIYNTASDSLASSRANVYKPHFDYLMNSNGYKATAPRPFYGKSKFYDIYLEEIMNFLLDCFAIAYPGVTPPNFYVYFDRNVTGSTKVGDFTIWDELNTSISIDNTQQVYSLVYDRNANGKTKDANSGIPFTPKGRIQYSSVRFMSLYLKQIRNFIRGANLDIMCLGFINTGDPGFTYQVNGYKAGRMPVVDTTAVSYNNIGTFAGSSSLLPSMATDIRSLETFTRDGGVNDWSLNSVRPTYPAVVNTSDNNLLFVDLLKAKADSNITFDSIIGKFSVRNPNSENNNDITTNTPLFVNINNINFIKACTGGASVTVPSIIAISDNSTSIGNILLLDQNLVPLHFENVGLGVKEVLYVNDQAIFYISTDGHVYEYDTVLKTNTQDALGTGLSNVNLLPVVQMRMTQLPVYNAVLPIACNSSIFTGQTFSKVGLNPPSKQTSLGGYPGKGIQSLFYTGQTIGAYGFVLDFDGMLWGANVESFDAAGGTKNIGGNTSAYFVIIPPRYTYTPGAAWEISVSQIGLFIGAAPSGGMENQLFPLYPDPNTSTPLTNLLAQAAAAGANNAAIQLRIAAGNTSAQTTSFYFYNFKPLVKFQNTADQSELPNKGSIFLDLCKEPNVTLRPSFDELTINHYYPLRYNKRPNTNYHSEIFVIGDPVLVPESAWVSSPPAPKPVQKTIISSGIVKKTQQVNKTDNLRWVITSNPTLFSNSTPTTIISNDYDCQITMDKSDHTPKVLTYTDDWQIRCCSNSLDTKNRSFKTRIKVYPRTLPKVRTKLSGTLTYALTPSFLEFKLLNYNIFKYQNIAYKISNSNVLKNCLNSGSTVPWNNLSLLGSFSYGEENIRETTVSSFANNSPNKSFLFGVGVGSSVITFIEGTFKNGLTKDPTSQGKSLSFTIEVWDVTGLTDNSNAADPNTIFMAKNQNPDYNNKGIPLQIQGNSSYPHKWTTSDTGILRIAVNPLDSRQATLYTYGTGTAYFTVQDSANIPWISQNIVVQ